MTLFGLLPTHRGVQCLHSEGGWVYVSVGIHIRLLSPWVRAGVLDRGLHIHHLQVCAELLLRHAVTVESILADEVRVQVGRHARAGRHLHVLH